MAEGAKLRIGIAGTGFVGRIHARSALLAGARLAAVAGSSPERAQAAAAALGAERGFGDAMELARSADVDVLHVCTPNHLHEPLAIAALEAGKHVVLEKPVALDIPGAHRIAAAAERAGRLVTVPFAYRYYPTVREARARIGVGETGPLHLLQGGYLQDWLLEASDDNWRVDPELGGASRAFADIGSHCCDMLEFVSGQRIARVSARVAITNPERAVGGGESFSPGGEGDGTRAVETEDIAMLMFETDAGVLGSAVISQVSAGRKNRLWFELAGSHQTLTFDGEQPERLWAGSRGGAALVPRDPATLDPAAARYATLPAGHPQGYEDLFEAFIRETYEAMSTGEMADGLPLLADGIRAIEITAAVLASAREQRWVGVPEDG